MGGAATSIGEAIAVDSFGNVYTTGAFFATADFDPSASGTYNLTSAGYGDIFISKLNSSGNFVAAGRIGGNSFYEDYGYAIMADDSGNVYTTGHFANAPDFDPGAGS